MPPRITAFIHAPTPLSFTSTPPGLSVTRADKPATTPAPVGAASAHAMPTERGAQLRESIERSHALSAKIRQTKALNAAGKAQGVQQGQGKRHASSARSQASDPEDIEDDNASSDDDEGSIVLTSEPRELLEEITGHTYQDELKDPEFRSKLANDIHVLLKDKQKTKNYSRETLQEVLWFVRRGPSVSNGASQWNTPVVTLPPQAVKGGSGYHRDHEPQIGEKRRSDASQADSSKRGQVVSRTPSTVLENTPPPFGLPGPAIQLVLVPPLSPPPTAALHGSGMPPGLPRTNAVHVPEGIWERPALAGAHPSQSPSPLPASFRAALDNTQTMPEETQTVLEDMAPSSPDLGSPQFDRQPLLPLSSSLSLGGGPAPRAEPTSTRSGRSTTGSQANSSRAEKIAEMADRFDRNERNRERAFAILQNRRASQRTLDADNDLVEVDAADRADARKAAQGKPAKRKPKMGLNCQPGRPALVAARAVTDSTACAFAIGPYLARGSYIILALEMYERSWPIKFPNEPMEPAIPDLLGAITDRAPGSRTVAKRNLRPLMTSQDGFGFQENPATQKQIDTNIALYKAIREKFHFGSLTDPGSHYEHPALEAGFVRAFFQDCHSPCAVYHTYFAPAAPPQSIALLLTLIEACIGEWSTGVYVAEDLNSKGQLVTYKKHLHNLGVFARGALGRFEKMRKSFYEAGCRQSVCEANPEVPTQATIRLEDVRPDSPPPASAADAAAGNDA